MILVVRSIRGETVRVESDGAESVGHAAKMAAIALGYHESSSYTLARDGVALQPTAPAPTDGLEYELVDMGNGAV